MVKSWCVLLGVGLTMLWVIGLANNTSPSWLIWADGLAALASFVVGGFIPDERPLGRLPILGPYFLSIVVFAAWAIGFANLAPPWLVWWNFGFACCYFLVGFAASGRSPSAGSSEELRDAA